MSPRLAPRAIDFERLFQASPNPYMLLDRDLRYVAANPAYLRVTASRLDELVGRHVFEAFPHDPSSPDNDSVRQLRASFQRVLERRVPDVVALVAYRVPTHVGDHIVLEERTWSATHTPLLDDEGQVAFILQHTVDITELQALKRPPHTPTSEKQKLPPVEQLQAEVLGRAQRVQEINLTLDTERRHLLRMFEQAPGFMCFLRGPQHVFELANKAYYQLMGHRELLGKTVRQALPDVEGQGFFELLDKVYTSGTPFIGRAMRLLVQRSPGGPFQPRFVDFIYQPIIDPDGTVTGIFVQGHDITEQKHLEAERDRLAAIVEQSTDFIGVGTLGGAVTYVNEAGQRMVGLPPGQASRFRLLDYFQDEDRAFVEQTILPTVVRHGRWEGGLRFRHFVTGTSIPTHHTVFAVRDPETHDIRWIATITRDTTAQKQQESERDALLQREQQARAEAEEANRLKDDFLAMVSHELRTPLNAMLGWIRLLRAGQVPTEQRARALDTVERNGRLQSQVIDDLLDISRIASGKLKLQMTTVTVAAVVESSLDTVRAPADAKGIELHASLDPDARVLGDEDRLYQVIWNLLSNAVKFTPAHGHVHARLERKATGVELSVIDTGKGISDEFLPHIFERFRQAEGGTTRSFGGLGLGLAIVKQLVDLHGGTIDVSSGGDGKGACFTVTLPFAPPSSAAPSSSEPSSAAPSTPPPASPPALPFPCPPEVQGLRLLIVDDEPDARDMMRDLLERCGAEVTTASSAEEAFALLPQLRPDLLLSDISMPGEDGYSLMRRIRALPPEQGGKTPAIAVTAHTRAPDRTRALVAGYKAHIPKPIDPAEMFAVIISVLQVHGSR
ncbi:PAS domain-containing hybrid sensor histidine kinase/response regulator [Chondromyces crocatus]|uniref:histidine kinase n=1 Tax=Chondromyces crocatus TaxID=52 RepID=A0A0K1EQ39_CHOCO|nr:PAS domain-containing protein [Chondromyces crocatus]AKT42762.1 uncharacterized protein CMC5_069890 [Chondromyces crocatus]